MLLKKFYISTLKKIIGKFPFGDKILQDFGILVPEKLSSYSVNTVIRLVKHFLNLSCLIPVLWTHSLFLRVNFQ